MKRKCIKFIQYLIVFLLLTGTCFAENYAAINDEAITVADTAIGFTTAKLTVTSGSLKGRPADAALITVETNNIRFRHAGDPTSSVGHLLIPGQSYFITGSTDVRNFKAIRVTNNATVYCTYFVIQNK